MWKSVKQLLWDWRGVAIAAPSVASLVLLIRFVGLLQTWEWAAFDQYMRLRPPSPPDDRVLIVGINETDVKSIGQAIISDQVYAQLLEKLRARKPRAIGLDIYRDLPVEPGHQQLVRIFKSTPNLVGIQKVVGKKGQETVAPPPALKAKGQVGANDLITDADNKVRRGFVDVNAANGEKVFSFSLYLALLYLEADGVTPQMIPHTHNWHLGKATFIPFEANDGGYVRAEASGNQILINYRGGSHFFKTVSMQDVLTDRLPPDWGRDRVILIGVVSESFQDTVFTPYSGGLVRLPEPMSGVEVHANLVSQFISSALDGRPLIQSWSEPQEWLWILVWSGVGAVLAWQMRHAARNRTMLLMRAAIAAGSGIVLLGSTYLLLVLGWWVPLIPPLLALVGSATAITGYVAHSAGRIRKTFGRYLTDEIVANLLESPTGLSLGGERREITILTSDLRGFTATAEQLPPEEVIRIVNFYLGHMAQVITRYQGTIDEFMGDGILVLFGAPTKREDDVQRAIACAVEMQLALKQVNQVMRDWGYAELEMGIGINTGEVVVGNIGSEQRTKYGVMGSQVNLTYRIESYTVGGQILISERTFELAGRDVETDEQKEVKPKGIKNTINIYSVTGIRGKYNVRLAQEEDLSIDLSEPIQVHYVELSGKQIGESLCQAQIIQLSSRGALLKITAPTLDDSTDGAAIAASPLPLTNIKLNLLNWEQSAAISDDCYAKVLDVPAPSGRFYICFTAKPPAIATYLANLYHEHLHAAPK